MKLLVLAQTCPCLNTQVTEQTTGMRGHDLLVDAYLDEEPRTNERPRDRLEDYHSSPSVARVYSLLCITGTSLLGSIAAEIAIRWCPS